MIGIDLVEHIEIINKDDRFIRRILSSKEYEIYSNKKIKKRQIEYAASRFAAKEAIFKAYKHLPIHLDFRDVTILNDENYAPYVVCEKMKLDVEISITHTPNYSVAVAILKSHLDDC